MKRETDSAGVRKVLYRIAAAAVTALLAAFIGRFLCWPHTVSGHSMEPAAAAQDVVLTDRVSYRLTAPRRGDVALFSREDGTVSVKRIIGLPGETVQITGGQVKIDGKTLWQGDAPYAVSVAGTAAEPVTLKEGEYFLMGDREASSEDSRSDKIGNIPRERLLGRVWMRVWPLDRIGFPGRGGFSVK